MVQFRVRQWLGLDVKVDGMAIAKADGLQLAFNDPKDAEKLWEADTEAISIPWEQLSELKIDYGFVHDEIHLAVTNADLFGSLPGVRSNQVELDVRKAEREALKQFEKRATQFRSGKKKDDVDDMLDDIRGFLYDQ